MRMIGCDLRATQQTIAMLDGESGEVVERTLKHDGTTIREFYAGLPRGPWSSASKRPDRWAGFCA
jgi:hypothetical protein